MYTTGDWGALTAPTDIVFRISCKYACRALSRVLISHEKRTVSQVYTAMILIQVPASLIPHNTHTHTRIRISRAYSYALGGLGPVWIYVPVPIVRVWVCAPVRTRAVEVSVCMCQCVCVRVYFHGKQQKGNLMRTVLLIRTFVYSWLTYKWRCMWACTAWYSARLHLTILRERESTV